jgi:hypothetical protein
MLREHIKKSFQLNKSHFGVFIGSVLILFLGSIFTVFLIFPSLVTGLEGMYLRARKGHKIQVTDIFMHMGKFFPLLGTSLLIVLDLFLTTTVFLIIPLFLLLAFFILIAKLEPTNPIIFIIAVLFSVGYTLFIFYREGQYLHALNFVAESGLKPRESLRESKKATKNRWEAALLAFFLFFAFGCLLSILSPYPIALKIVFLFLGLFLSLMAGGATAMAFAYHHVEHQTKDC